MHASSRGRSSSKHLHVIHEKWKTDDWTWMMFPASGSTPWQYGTTPNDGTTVISDPTQNSTFVGIRYVYKF